MSAVIFQTQSLLITALLSLGIYKVAKTKYARQHMKIMKAVIVWDLLLILQIELNRGAVAKASKALENSVMLNIHISLAISAVLLYIYLYLSGKKIHKSGKMAKLGADSRSSKRRKRHKMLGYAAFTCRLATLITSFLIL